jgi:hypothetical protein
VTSAEFENPTASSASPRSTPASSTAVSAGGEIPSDPSSLGSGDKAGIAIGSILGAGLVVSGILFLLLKRKRKGVNVAVEHRLGPIKAMDAQSDGSNGPRT